MLSFTASRGEPELVVPARATPREVRSLSDVDNSQELRYYTTLVYFFRCLVPPGEQPPPASSLKAALAEALVHYYPVAGRLRKLRGGKHKLAVDCTAEGVVFVEAHADVRLQEFGKKPLVPPYPCVEELMCDGVGDFRAMFGKPLLYLQMTQLKCGGVVLALTMNHCIADAFGMVQILRCILDLARGQAHPAVLPVWERHLLVSQPMAMDDEAMVDDDAELMTMIEVPPLHGMVVRSFVLGQREINVLRNAVDNPSATVFELVTAAVWRCRAAALGHQPHDRLAVVFTKNARGSWNRGRPLPPGFYGNGVFLAVAEATAGELCGHPLAYAVGLVHEAKVRVTDHHVRSVLDLMARGEYHVDVEVSPDRTFVVSDITRCGDDSLDLGWAEHVGGGVPMAGEIITMLTSFLMSCKGTNRGEECVVVPMCLPELAMQRFTSQIAAMFARSSM